MSAAALPYVNPNEILGAFRDTIAKARARMTVIPYARHYEAEVLNRAREMHAESVLHRDMLFDEAHLLQQFERAWHDSHLYFRICVKDDEVLGGFFGGIGPTFFSATLIAKDYAWFVKPSARGSCAAVALLADFEEWAQARGVRHIVIGQSTGVQMQATKMLYERLGYETIGVNTVKRI